MPTGRLRGRLAKMQGLGAFPRACRPAHRGEKPQASPVVALIAGLRAAAPRQSLAVFSRRSAVEEEDDRDNKDEPATAKRAASKAKAAPVDEQLALLREIRDTVRSAHERQDRYLWLLLPVIAILLVIAIFQAVKL
jgi:hypothetical protein